MFWQQMVLASHAVYLNFFLKRGINVFTWNYRGYGRSKGHESPGSFAQDIDSVVNYLRKELKLTGKLGVYGRSLGGIPTSAMTANCDMVIVDRSFSNLHEMAVWKYFGQAASMMFKIGSCGWQVQSDFNFLKDYKGLYEVSTEENNENSNFCYKVITVDKNDEIVHVQASLMMGAAIEISL